MAGVTFDLRLGTSEYRRALAIVARETRQTARTSVQQTRRIDDAWERLGGTSTRDVQREIVKVNTAFLRVANSGTASAQDIANAYQRSRERIAELRREAGLVPPAINRAGTAARQLNAAYQSLNIRPAAEIRAEMRRVETATRRVGRAAGRSGEDMRRAARAARVRMRELRGELRGVEQGMHGAAGGAQLLRGALATIGIAGLVQVTRSIVDATVAQEGFQRSFAQGAGSAAAGAEEYRYVRDEADRLGFSLRDTAGAYSDFLNATRGTAAAGEITREVFTGVLEASRALNRSQEDTNGTLLALGQIAGKGKVSMEELRQQLGERLPGAMQIAARAMDVTVPALEDMVAKGIPAEDFFANFGKTLTDEFGAKAAEASDGAAASFGRLQTALFDLRVEAGNSGIVDAVAGLAEVTRTDVIPAVSATIKWIGDFGAALAHLDAVVQNFGNDLREGLGLERLAGDSIAGTEALAQAELELEQLRAKRIARQRGEVQEVQRTADEIVAIEQATVAERARIAKLLEQVGRDVNDAEVGQQAAKELGAAWGEYDKARLEGDEDAVASAKARWEALKELGGKAAAAAQQLERAQVQAVKEAGEAKVAIDKAVADERLALTEQLADAEQALTDKTKALKKEEADAAKAAASERVKAEQAALDEIADLREEAARGLGEPGEATQAGRAIEAAGPIFEVGRAYTEVGRVYSDIRRARREGDTEALKAAKEEAKAIHEQADEFENAAAKREIQKLAEDAFREAAEGAADALERQVEANKPVEVEVETDAAKALVDELTAKLKALDNETFRPTVEVVLAGGDPDELLRRQLDDLGRTRSERRQAAGEEGSEALEKFGAGGGAGGTFGEEEAAALEKVVAARVATTRAAAALADGLAQEEAAQRSAAAAAREAAAAAREAAAAHGQRAPTHGPALPREVAPGQPGAPPAPGQPVTAPPPIVQVVQFKPDTTEADAATAKAAQPVVKPVVHKSVVGGVPTFSGGGGAAPTPVPGLHTGGPVGPPGTWGGGDKWPLLGEAGEFMLNKYAVRALGMDTVEAINRLRAPPQRLTAGGAVARLPSLAGPGAVREPPMSKTELTINLGGAGYRLQGESAQVEGFAQAVLELDRKLSHNASGA